MTIMMMVVGYLAHKAISIREILKIFFDRLVSDHLNVLIYLRMIFYEDSSRKPFTKISGSKELLMPGPPRASNSFFLNLDCYENVLVRRHFFPTFASSSISKILEVLSTHI